MNPYAPPKDIENETIVTETVLSEGNFRMFAAGVAMIVVGAGLLLFRHLAHSFAGGPAPLSLFQDWVLWFIGVGAVLVHFGQRKRIGHRHMRQGKRDRS